MTSTSNPILGLTYVNNGDITARWNFPLAEGTPLSSPGGLGRPVTISYSFQSDIPAYAWQVPQIEGPVTEFSPAYQAATEQALAEIASVANITFVRAPAGTEGQMVFRHSWQETTSGFAFSPAYEYYVMGSEVAGSITELDYAGDVWIDNIDLYSGAGLQPGGRGYLVLLHEIGHALGLQHSFDDSYGQDPPDWVMSRGLDNERYSVMTYTAASGMAVTGTPDDPRASWGSVSAGSLMMLDIEALQYLYGANTRGTTAGNSTYSWGTHQEMLETIWDGGGVDMIDASLQLLPNVINLNPGTFSSIGMRPTPALQRWALDIPDWYTGALPADVYDGRNNVAIAKGVIIEDARGGQVDDVIAGNRVANKLYGLGGNDTLNGGAGNDVLSGGPGDDRMVGGTGNDTYYVRDLGDTVYEAANAGADIVVSSLPDYLLGNYVEHGRILAEGSANLTGNGLDNTIFAGKGSNGISGRGGVDTLSYQYGAASGVTVSLALTTSQVTGGSGKDRLFGFENLTGSAFADRLTGNGGSNVLKGLEGNDVLLGLGGADVLTGGAGRDLFDYNHVTHSGTTAGTRDVITDFTRGQDRIDLSTIDAKPATAGNDAFSFIGGSAFSGTDATGQVRFAGGVLYASTDADSAPEFSVALTGVATLAAGDIVL